MIHANILKRQADRDGLTASAVERDYVLAHVLAAIARRDEQAQFAFKGGTALRLCYFESYRYSADLDFSLVNHLGMDRALELVVDALGECKERVGFPTLRLRDATPPRIEYVGPLGAKPRPLKLDLADDELVEDVATLPIVARYPDQEPCQCLAYTLGEVAAEKLRCIIQRLQCRDLYDLNELLVVRDVDARMIWPVFERKARHRDLEPDRFAGRFEDLQPEWRRRWDGELSGYVVDGPPPFEEVLRGVRRELRFALR